MKTIISLAAAFGAAALASLVPDYQSTLLIVSLITA